MKRAPNGDVGPVEPLRVIFPESEKQKCENRWKGSRPGLASSFVNFFHELSLWTLFKIVLITGLVLFEFTKLNTCFIQNKDMVQRDLGARQESVCVDHTKVAMFGHRFGKGCEEARRSVEEGIIHGTYTCFVEKHRIYGILSFDNVYVNVMMGILVLYICSSIKDYCIQVQVAKQNADTFKKMGLCAKTFQNKHQGTKSFGNSRMSRKKSLMK